MSRLLVALTALLLSLHAAGQEPATLESWAERLQTFGTKIPQEEVFVHMDNTCYYLGDTIYYKAYMRLSDGRPSPLSRLLYVELLNQDGYLVERQKIEMSRGHGHGSFCLPDSLYGGFYELRAYTRWQLNWGEHQHPHTKSAEQWFYSKKMAHEYFRDYDKLYSRVFPVYNKPQQPGQYDQVMTTRPLRRYFKASEGTSQATVTFYPEGGHLVAGTQCRVAFEANDLNDGHHLKGGLTVKDRSGNVVAQTEVKSRGRGSFLLDCKEGEQYVAEFTWNGITERWKLPKAGSEGCALQATTDMQGIHLRLQARGQAATEPLGLTASCHGVMKYFRALEPNTDQRIDIPADSLQTGVIQLTIFNAEGRIYADRLVFVNKGDIQAQNITFSGLNATKYAPYSPVTLNLKGETRGTVSLAVRDSHASNYTFDSGNILTEMLLASQLKGFVEQPEYFFEADDDFHRYALDLLLMVQGWRRYDWVTMATPKAFTLSQPYERTELLTGEVNAYQTEEQEDLLSRSSFIATFIDGENISETPLIDRPHDPQIQSLLEKNIVRIFNESAKGQRAYVALWGSSQSGRTAPPPLGKLKNEVLMHAEFVQPGVKNGAVLGEMMTFEGGHFKIEAPRFYEGCFFSLSASDSTRWKKGKPHTWINSNENSKQQLEYPEFYVKLTTPFPRFVKPYSFYQSNLPESRMRGGKTVTVDNAIILNEVTVGAKRSGSRQFDAGHPALVLDAYQAFNEVCDAGLCPGYFIGSSRFVSDVAHTYIGDMNMERSYQVETRINTTAPSAVDVDLFSEAELMRSDKSLLTDPRVLRMQNAADNAAHIAVSTKDKYDHLTNLDKVYIYTDYSPRNEGSENYNQDNQPTVTVDLRRYEDDSHRMAWRDRRMLLTGYAVCDDFYQPDYSGHTPSTPTDYRRTLYWNPDLQLDEQGQATVSFYTGSQQTRLTVSAEGMSPTGQPLTGISYPEDQE